MHIAILGACAEGEPLTTTRGTLAAPVDGSTDVMATAMDERESAAESSGSGGMGGSTDAGSGGGGNAGSADGQDAPIDVRGGEDGPSEGSFERPDATNPSDGAIAEARSDVSSDGPRDAAEDGDGSPIEAAPPGPCTGLCPNPIIFTTPFSSGALGTAATCHQTTTPLQGYVCGNFVAPRSFAVNGMTVTCNGSGRNVGAPRNGGYCFQATAGNETSEYFGTY